MLPDFLVAIDEAQVLVQGSFAVGAESYAKSPTHNLCRANPKTCDTSPRARFSGPFHVACHCRKW